MPQPPLDKIQWDTGLHRHHTEAMPEPFGRGLRAGDACLLHHFDDTGIGSFTAPRPQQSLGLAVADAVHQVQRIEEGGRHRHSTVKTGAALLLYSQR